MVKRLFRFLNKETSSLHGAAYLLGLFAILSQILAFLRDRLLAHIFGASLELDIYYAAFRIPDFIFVLAASVVSLSVLVPFIVEKESVSRESVREFVDSIFSFFSVLIVAVCVLAFLLMPYLSGFLYKGFSPEVVERIVFVSRILLLSPIALGFSNLFGSLTQAYSRFTIYALAPLLYNTGIIVGILAFARELGAAGVAVGVILGASMHALVQVPFVFRLGLFPRVRAKFNFHAIRRVVMLSLPRTLTLSTTHIIVIFLVSFASLMAEGSISVLSLSINLQSVPLTIVGVSYSLAAFPTLSRYFTDNNIKAFVGQMTSTARHIIFWSLPITALFIVLRAQIVRVLLGTGSFDWDDTRLVAAALALFVISAMFQSLLLLFMRGFYSAGITRKPLILNLIAMLITVASAYLLVKVFYASNWLGGLFADLLKVGDLPSTAVLVLPLAFSIGMTINGIMHWISFERQFRGFSKEVYVTLLQSFGASVMVGAAAYVGLNIFAPVFDMSSLFGIFLQGLFAGILGIAVGVGVLHVLGSRELKEASRTVRARFWRNKVIATDPEIV
jgi:putative peptidoglycan lipid II flippase